MDDEVQTTEEQRQEARDRRIAAEEAVRASAGIPEHPTLRYFDYGHLPEPQAVVSQLFHDLAHEVGGGKTAGPETSAGLRKLLEAKDCFVRASLCERVEESG